MYIRYLDLPASILLKDIHGLWEQNDILILLIDLDSYTLNTRYLDDDEKEALNNLKTSYFRERYIVSRTVLKYVLHYLLKGQSIFKISTYKDEWGRVHVRDHEELYICISYTGNIVSLAISKVNIGIDIELKKSRSIGRFSKYLNMRALETDGMGNGLDILTLFTLKEAYSKFSNKSILFCLNKELDLDNTFSLSYILNGRYILSIVTDARPNAINIGHLQKIEDFKSEI